MTAFVAAVDAGGLSAAARRLGRSPASITRAVALLEARIGSELLRRTTRSMKLTAQGERYLGACRRILAEVADAEREAEGEAEVPRGVLAITAPAAFGRLHVRPLIDAFLQKNLEVRARLSLLDRIVHLVDEGFDVAIRIAHLPDSSLVAVKVGEVRRVVCASPDYLARAKRPKKPADLAGHDCISSSQATPADAWTFAAGPTRRRAIVKIRPRLVVNAAEPTIASALDGRGITRVLSYQVERELRDGRLVRLLDAFEPEPLPVHVVYPEGSASNARIRAFVDLAVPRLRAILTRAELPAR